MKVLAQVGFFLRLDDCRVGYRGSKKGRSVYLFTELPGGVLLENPPRAGCPKQSEQRNRCYTRRPVLLELLSRLEVLVFIPERFSHLFRCSGNL